MLKKLKIVKNKYKIILKYNKTYIYSLNILDLYSLKEQILKFIL